MTHTRDRWIAVIGLLVLLVLHVDAWRPQRPELWFGWMPEELLYRLTWMLAAFCYLAFVVARVWREEPD